MKLDQRDPLERRSAAHGFVGKRVRLTRLDRYKSVRERAKAVPHVWEGALLAVAMPAVGTIADLAILDRNGRYPVAISLASVEKIEELR